MTREGVHLLNEKVEEIKNMTKTKSHKGVLKLIGKVNHYPEFRAMISHILQPLHILPSKNVKFKWTGIKQKVFYNIKQIMACNTLLAYIYFNNRFDIYMDARNLQ